MQLTVILIKYMKEVRSCEWLSFQKFGKEKAESLVNDFLFCYG
jgi:hypothetical protein